MDIYSKPLIAPSRGLKLLPTSFHSQDKELEDYAIRTTSPRQASNGTVQNRATKDTSETTPLNSETTTITSTQNKTFLARDDSTTTLLTKKKEYECKQLKNRTTVSKRSF